VRLCLRTAATNEPIVNPPGDMWGRRAMVTMMPARSNSWLFQQSSLAVLPAETSVASRRNGRRSENFVCQYLKYLKGSLTYRKILQGASGFTSHPKEGVLRIFIASAGFKTAILGSSGKHTNHYTAEATCNIYTVLKLLAGRPPCSTEFSTSYTHTYKNIVDFLCSECCIQISKVFCPQKWFSDYSTTLM
jgi:hypothetical protein